MDSNEQPLIGGTGRAKSKSAITESMKKQMQELKYLYRQIALGNGSNFEDGSLLSYTDHELSQEQWKNISGYIAKKNGTETDGGSQDFWSDEAREYLASIGKPVRE